MIEKVKGICRDNVEDLKNKVVILENCLQERRNLIAELEDIIKLFDDEEQFVSNLTPMQTFDILKKIGYEDEQEMTNIYVEMIKEIQSSPKENKVDFTNEETNNSYIDLTPISSVEEVSKDSKEEIEDTNEENSFEDNNDEFDLASLNVLNNLENNELEDNELEDNEVKNELIDKVDDNVSDMYIDTDNKEELQAGNDRIVNHFLKLFDSNFISDEKSYFIKNNRVNKEILTNNLRQLFNTDFEVENVMDMLCQACTNGMNFDDEEIAEIKEELENITV